MTEFNQRTAAQCAQFGHQIRGFAFKGLLGRGAQNTFSFDYVFGRRIAGLSGAGVIDVAHFNAGEFAKVLRGNAFVEKYKTRKQNTDDTFNLREQRRLIERRQIINFIIGQTAPVRHFAPHAIRTGRTCAATAAARVDLSEIRREQRREIFFISAFGWSSAASRFGQDAEVARQMNRRVASRTHSRLFETLRKYEFNVPARDHILRRGAAHAKGAVRRKIQIGLRKTWI